jgi:hypothetical protein
MSDRKTLALSKDTPVKKSQIPKQRDITCKVRVQFEPSSALLDYQRVFDSHGSYLVRKITVNPEQFVDETKQRYLLINDLKKEPFISLNIDQNMVNGTKSEEDFLNYVDKHCKDVLRQELKVFSELLDATKCHIISSVLTRIHELFVDDELADDISEWLSRKLIIKGSKGKYYLNWKAVIDPCFKPLMQNFSDPGFNVRLVPPGSKFGFVNVMDNATLRVICGLTPTKYRQVINPLSFNIYVGDRKHSVLKNALEVLLQSSKEFFRDLREPILGAAVFGKQDDTFISKFAPIKTRARDLISNIEFGEELERDARTQRKKDIIEANSKVIAENTENEGERLQLTIKQGIHPGHLYFETITTLVREQLMSFLVGEFELDYPKNKTRLVGYNFDEWQMEVEHKRNDPKHGPIDYEICEATLPTLMALRVNEAIRRFFSEHKWFHSVDIENPKTIIYVEEYFDGERTHLHEETIVVRNFFRGEFVPYNNQLLVDMKYFNELISTDGGEKSNN